MLLVLVVGDGLTGLLVVESGGVEELELLVLECLVGLLGLGPADVGVEEGEADDVGADHGHAAHHGDGQGHEGVVVLQVLDRQALRAREKNGSSPVHETNHYIA